MIKEINLLNKRILYIGPIAFHYDIALINKLIELGAIVDSFNMYPPSDLYFKIVNKLKIPYVKRYYSYLKRYYYNNPKLLRRDYDYVLIRHGIQFDINLITKLRRLNSRSKFINFHWDSIRPEYNYSDKIKYFDKVFSFDYKDCQNYPEIQYLPLFYLDEYEEFRKCNYIKYKEIDVLFIGSWRDRERYHLIKSTKNICKQSQVKFYYYLYFSIKHQKEAMKKGFKAYEAKQKLLSHKEILNLFAITNTVIDFHSTFQTGLTMRTFEALGAGKKLITTNKNILNEPFYNPEYINILDVNDLKFDINFIRNAPTSSIEEKIKYYSLKNYIYKLLQ